MTRKLTVIQEKEYLGPNMELDQQAMVLTLTAPGDSDPEAVWTQMTEKLPELARQGAPKGLGDLFARAVIRVQQLGMNLFATQWSAREEADRLIVAVQYIDLKTCRRTVDFVLDWMNDILDNRVFPYTARYQELEHIFYRSRFGGPTIYSIIEAGYRKSIPMFYIPSENVFQWGQGRKQLRGRSTVLHRDSIKDTELTSQKDLAKEFLEDLGFPIPTGRLCYTAADAEKAAEELGFPVVTKPVDGHKGQGVSTMIGSMEELRMGFDIAREAGKLRNDPVIVEKHVAGTDHRLLTISGKFIAALQRIPAYVEGDGTRTIAQLIETENARPERADTPRSALGKIVIDDDLTDYLREHGRSLSDVPAAAEHVVLRRVANISAGGVSVNVTNRIHPDNIKLAEDVARFLDVHVLGIDLLAEDISKSWRSSSCAIIEINAGPGVFMHLVPAIGESVNVPECIVTAFFPSCEAARIPTLVFNKLSDDLTHKLTDFALKQDHVEEVGAARLDGVQFNKQFFSKRPCHASNIRNVMRNPKLDVALLEYRDDVIQNEGLYHWGADVVVLDDPSGAEKILARDLLQNGMLVEIDRKAKTMSIRQNGKETVKKLTGSTVSSQVAREVKPVLKTLIQQYYTPFNKV